MGVSYSYFSGVQLKQLKTETELASQGVSMSGMDYLNSLEAKDYRITWIDADGTVLFDNAVNTNEMENHLEREEIKEALANGYGESVRYSSTLSDKQLYSAIRLSDGSVLRLSIVQMAVWTLLFGFAQPICFVILIAFVLSFVLASRLTKRILKPINSIDPDDPMQHIDEEEYKEIVPLLRRIQSQNEQLKRDQKEIEKAALIRQEFTANVSHELKTPLALIMGYAEGLKEEVNAEDPSGRDFYCDVIIDESNKMNDMVKKLLTLNQLEFGNDVVNMERFDICELIANYLTNADILIKQHEAKVIYEPQKPVYVWSDEFKIEEVLMNYFSNALNHLAYEKEIQIRVVEKGDVVRISVFNTGDPIPEESLPHLFEKFYKVDKARTREYGGSGVGLSIVKAIMESIHQEYGVCNYENGVEFWFELPIK